MRCYQRDDDNASDPIPGCSGLGVPTWDYCYLESYVSPPPEPHPYSIPACETGCENDFHCKVRLEVWLEINPFAIRFAILTSFCMLYVFCCLVWFGMYDSAGRATGSRM